MLSHIALLLSKKSSAIAHSMIEFDDVDSSTELDIIYDSTLLTLTNGDDEIPPPSNPGKTVSAQGFEGSGGPWWIWIIVGVLILALCTCLGVGVYRRKQRDDGKAAGQEEETKTDGGSLNEPFLSDV